MLSLYRNFGLEFVFLLSTILLVMKCEAIWFGPLFSFLLYSNRYGSSVSYVLSSWCHFTAIFSKFFEERFGKSHSETVWDCFSTALYVKQESVPVASFEVDSAAK